jgi:RNA polymerase sigma-70 factor (ECF subfamily)
MTYVDTAPTSFDTPDVDTSMSEPQTYEELYEEYQPIFFAKALKYGLSHHEAEDAAQTALLNVYVNLNKYEERGYTPKRWMHTVMRNVINDEYRKATRRPVVYTDALPDIYHPTDILTEARFNDIEYENTVDKIEDMLPEDIGKTFAHFLRTDDKSAEIAEETGTKEETVRTRIHRARKIMKKNKDFLKELGIIQISEN